MTGELVENVARYLVRRTVTANGSVLAPNI